MHIINGRLCNHTMVEQTTFNKMDFVMHCASKLVKNEKSILPTCKWFVNGIG